MNAVDQLFSKHFPISEENILKAFNAKLKELNFLNIAADEVVIDYEGVIFVTFSDDESEAEVAFLQDAELGPIAIIVGEDDEETIIELGELHPPTLSSSFGVYLNLTNLEWLDEETMELLLQADAMIDDEEVAISTLVHDKHGYIKDESLYIAAEDLDELHVDERKITVIRGGKRVRKPIVRKIRRKILTGKQKSTFRRAARKRKAKMSKILRKRKKSLRIRKRMKIKTPKLTKFQKAAGTANRTK
jgi:hypothetical protein